MTHHHPPTAPTSAAEPVVEGADSPDHGIKLASVLVALAVLAALVVTVFWALPAWFGSSIINVTVRQ